LMKTNGESIWSSQASPLMKTPWGRATQKSCAAKTRLYLHVFHWPQDGKLNVAGLPGKATGAMSLDGGKVLESTVKGDEMTIALPKEMPDKIATVIAVELAK